MNFYLSNRSIYCRVFPRPYQEVKFYIKETCRPDQWSKKKQRVKYNHPRANEINELIEAVGGFIRSELTKAKIEGRVFNAIEFKQVLNNRFFASDHSAVVLFSQYVDIWLENKKPTVTASSYRSYRSKLKVVTSSYPGLKIKQITNVKFKEIQAKLLNDGVYKKNSIVKVLKLLKTVTNEAVKDGLLNTPITTNLSIGYETTEAIYLTWDQINTLYRFNYSSDRLRNAVRLWLIGAFTGQRYSDFSRVNNEMVFSKGEFEYIRLKQKKQKTFVTIPLRPELKEILNDPPKVISQAKLREYIKEAASEAGIANYDKIGTHTARRSFATNYVLDGVPIHLIMKMGGWKTEASFRAYVRYNDIIAGIEVVENENYIKALEKYNKIG